MKFDDEIVHMVVEGRVKEAVAVYDAALLELDATIKAMLITGFEGKQNAFQLNADLYRKAFNRVIQINASLGMGTGIRNTVVMSTQEAMEKGLISPEDAQCEPIAPDSLN